MTEFYHNFPPQRFFRLRDPGAIAQEVVGLGQVHDGLGGVAHHQHHHYTRQEPSHGTVSPRRKGNKLRMAFLVFIRVTKNKYLLI